MLERFSKYAQKSFSGLKQSTSAIIPQYSFLFQRKYPGEYTFEEALKHANIVQTGNAHSAIDDAKTLARLMINLYKAEANISAVTNYHQF